MPRTGETVRKSPAHASWASYAENQCRQIATGTQFAAETGDSLRQSFHMNHIPLTGSEACGCAFAKDQSRQRNNHRGMTMTSVKRRQRLRNSVDFRSKTAILA